MAKFLGPNLDINTNPGGDEGGEIHLAAPSTGTTLSGNVNIDVYQNKVRIFESGGSNRGAYIDLSSASNSVGSNLLASGGGATTLDGLTDVTAPSPSAGEYLAFNGSVWVNSAISIQDISEITAPSPSSGDFLKWNGSAWVNDPINLGTDTTGDYVASLVAGSGITITNNSGEGATPTVTLSDVVANPQTATYTLALTDKNKMVEMNVGSANILYVPTDASVNFPVGSTIDVLQTGSGKTQIAAVSSGTTTINSASGFYLRAPWSSATLIKRAANTWVVVGDLATS